MTNPFFNNKSNAERLSNKLINWYGANSITKHLPEHSEIHVNNLIFIVSKSKQFDKSNGAFSLTFNSKPIECTQMYSLVNNQNK